MEDKRKETICAVVVTFNRKKLLGECLDTLLVQRRPLDSIIIIDNDSSDGTEEFLKEKYLNNSVFHYVRLPENTGGAGGFHEGMKKGIERGFDWLWLMDDDGKANTTTLDALYKKAKELNIKAIAPLVVSIENKGSLCSRLSNKSKKIYDVSTALALSDENGCIWNSASFFNGLLINRDVIQKIGLTIKDFFIWGDEREYQSRIIISGFRLCTYVGAIFQHPITKTRLHPILYGLIRVKWTDNNLKDYCATRNWIYITKKYNTYSFFLKKVIIHLLKYIYYFILVRKFDVKNLRIYFCALRDGYLGNLKLHKKYMQQL
ncbi:MAG: hypothetical protein A3G93_07860 [Nitrospinae bacterium RIFCSPLOWO2_12_FULL_45_22]|nr:MAG: hypothetical protein A3G93_07860 [Nitrospinae bacterium RIFCSPLOWO2_12_FULL_45_22]